MKEIYCFTSEDPVIKKGKVVRTTPTSVLVEVPFNENLNIGVVFYDGEMRSWQPKLGTVFAYNTEEEAKKGLADYAPLRITRLQEQIDVNKRQIAKLKKALEVKE